MRYFKTPPIFFLVLVFIIIYTAFSDAASINKYKSYNDAMQAVKIDKNRGGLFIFSSNWCVPCNALKNNTIQPLLSSLREHTIVHVVDIDVEKNIANEYKAGGIFSGSVPFYIITSRDGKKIIRTGTGYKSQNDFIKWYLGK